MSDLPYSSFNEHLRERFGCRVQRIAVDGGFTCPNIDGTKGRGGCMFCDASGSLAGYGKPGLSVREQIQRGVQYYSRRMKLGKIIVYFQSFTATYAPVDRQRELYNEALSADERVVGLAIGARADCLSEPVLDVLEEFHRKTYLWVDVGLESVNDETLRRINRQSTHAEFIDAMRRTKARGIRVCAHVIFGLPGDSDADMLASIDVINELNLDGVKIHNLYIDSESAYAKIWKKGRLEMIERDRYIDLVCQSIERLAPKVLIQRLTGRAPRGRHLAPDWSANKHQLLADIHKELARRKSL